MPSCAPTRWSSLLVTPSSRCSALLARILDGADLAAALDVFVTDWSHFAVVGLDDSTCARGAELAITLGVRTLDALHLGAAQRVGGVALPFLTYDLRQAQEARSLGWTVLGI